jgi:CO/xanthine dehydrogenase FAD-binding subunit
VNTTHHKSEITVDDYALDGSEQSLVIGTHTPLQAVFTAPPIPELIKHSMRGWTTWQQRSGITLEQALLSPGLAPQWIVALLAWGAHLNITTDDRRCIPLADYLRGVGSGRGRPSHLLLPIHPAGRRWGEASVGYTPSDQPIVTAIAVVDMDKDSIRLARLALTGVWREIARLTKAPDQLGGKPLTEKNILQAVEAIQDEVEPQDNWRGGTEYRRSMAGLMTRRAFEQCMTGEKGQ